MNAAAKALIETLVMMGAQGTLVALIREIGRASCRERV